MEVNRIIGEYTGPYDGPLLVCFAGMHGNEPAGVEALNILFTLLINEPAINPRFKFWGRMIGLAGNLRALRQNTRFIEKDMNRQWTPENVARIKAIPAHQRTAEDAEIFEILQLIETEIATYQPNKLIILDLHTTTASGGIFTITGDDQASVDIGTELHAPVVKGLLSGIEGTTLHYFNSENMGLPTVAVTFESGQHEDPLSVNRAIAATINCMRTVGNVKAEHVENRHDALLIEYSRGLPKIAELIMCHRIQAGDNFVMEPGFENFQKIKKGTLLAHDRHGPIYAQADASLLMPLYQKQGDDGFFLIKTVETFEMA
jgi:succinylglutamate desuccinylase